MKIETVNMVLNYPPENEKYYKSIYRILHYIEVKMKRKHIITNLDWTANNGEHQDLHI